MRVSGWVGRFSNLGMRGLGMIVAAHVSTVAVTVTPAGAQNIILDAPGFVNKKQPSRLPDVKAAPLAWPRLDPGAAICRTEADLDRLSARRQGEADGGVADCRIVTNPIAVTIVRRAGPGRTQVRLTDAANIVGWTDVWLPDKAPVTAGATTGR